VFDGVFAGVFSNFFIPAIFGVLGDFAGVFMSFFKAPILGVLGDFAGVFSSFFTSQISKNSQYGWLEKTRENACEVPQNS
jgi:hypothetical protein